jgi:S1-C subfamily serine protease
VGSGVLVAPDLILTCNHVVNDRLNSKIEVLFPNWDVVIGDVIKVNGKHDVALIKLKEPRKGYIQLGPTPRFKDTLTIRGFGYGPYLRQTGTYIRDDADHRGGSAVIRGAQARLGDSGGGVEDRNGKLVGIMWGATDGYTWFVRIDKIIKVLPQIVTASIEPDPDEKPEEGDRTPYVIENIKYSL